MKHYILKMINDFESFVVVRMLYENPRAEERYNNSRKSISACISMLAECETYFEARADADCDQDGYIPNEEMRILVEIKEALDKIR